MTLSIRNTLRTLSALALTAAFLPGCDGEDYEALGLSSEEIDAMSEEELDELAALEDDDDLEHSVDHKHLTAPVRPGEPVDPTDRPDDLTTLPSDGPTHIDVADTLWDPEYTHTSPTFPKGPTRVDVVDTLWDPQHTHGNGMNVDPADTLWDPQHTHGNGMNVDVADTLWDPQHTHTVEVVDGLAVPLRPTHTSLLVGQVGQAKQPDPGCQPYTEETRYTNG